MMRTGRPDAPVALITGATGYLGRHLLRHLCDGGWQVHALTRSDPAASNEQAVHWHALDGSTERVCEILTATMPDVVFHLAAEVRSSHGVADITPMVSAGVLFGTQVLEAMRQSGVTQIVNAGTYWQHHDNQPYSAYCLYAALKQAFADVLRAYADLYGFKAVTLELADIYGPDDSRPKLINQLADALVNDAQIDLSPGEQYIDLVHVDDVCSAFAAAADALCAGAPGTFQCFGVSSARAMTLRTLAERLETVSARHLRANWGARSYRPRETMQAWRPTTPLPGWSPRVSLEAGLLSLLTARGLRA